MEANLDRSTHCSWGTRKEPRLHSGRDILGDPLPVASDFILTSVLELAIITTFTKRKQGLKEIKYLVQSS